jgi:hypothetical protein
MSQAGSCERCGASLLPDAVFCARCGHPIGRPYQHQIYRAHAEPVSAYSGLVALLLCFFLGYLGIHRFYVGKIGTGLLYLVTGGLFGIGWIVDLVFIASGRFRDYYGFRLVVWEEPVSGPGLDRI